MKLRCRLGYHKWSYSNCQMETGTKRQCEHCPCVEYQSSAYGQRHASPVWIRLIGGTHKTEEKEGKMNQKIIDILVEYGCNPENYDDYKVAEEIRELVLADCTYCPHCGVNMRYWREELHEEHRCDWEWARLTNQKLGRR